MSTPAEMAEELRSHIRGVFYLLIFLILWSVLTAALSWSLRDEVPADSDGVWTLSLAGGAATAVIYMNFKSGMSTADIPTTAKLQVCSDESFALVSAKLQEDGGRLDATAQMIGEQLYKSRSCDVTGVRVDVTSADGTYSGRFRKGRV